MASIWVIEDGEYSDYRVVGVYSTKEHADRVRDLVGGEVNEWALDPLIETLNAGLTYYRVEMYRNGDVKQAGPTKISNSEVMSTYRTSVYMAIWPRTEAKRLIVEGWFRDEDHAIKVTNEKRTEQIASGLWPAS